MKKSDAIALLNKEGWTKADAQRVLKSLDFKRKNSINEIMILRAASKFAGAELLERQKSQATQKGIATRRKNQINGYLQQINELQLRKSSSSRNFQTESTKQLQQLKEQNKKLLEANQELQKKVKEVLKNKQADLPKDSQLKFKRQLKELSAQNKELLKANLALKKDNKDLKNITDAIKLRLTQETKHLLRLENSEIKKGLMRLLR